MAIIKNPNANNETVKDLLTRHRKYPELGHALDSRVERLRLDVFNGYNNASSCYSNAKGAKIGLSLVHDAWTKRPKVMKSLAQEFRQSEDVKKLKQLNAQIKELKNNS